MGEEQGMTGKKAVISFFSSDGKDDFGIKRKITISGTWNYPSIISEIVAMLVKVHYSDIEVNWEE